MLSENVDQYPVFHGIGQAEIAEICSRARLEHCSRNDLLFLTGDPVNHVYLVLDGTVKEFYTSSSGEECLVHKVSGGECPGLPALFHLKRHSSNAEAVARVRFLRWKADEFSATLRQCHVFCRNILKMLAVQLECVRKQRCFCHKASADSRVAHFLINRLCAESEKCRKCASSCLDLRPLSPTAQEIGLARETLTRVLGRMNKQGCIKVCRGRITVCNIDQMRDLTQGGF